MGTRGQKEVRTGGAQAPCSHESPCRGGGLALPGTQDLSRAQSLRRAVVVWPAYPEDGHRAKGAGGSGGVSGAGLRASGHCNGQCGLCPGSSRPGEEP